MQTLVTGAAGFVGHALCSALLAQGQAVRAAVRSAYSMPSVDGLDVAAVGDVGTQTDWSKALAGVDCVIHCAARAHVIHETEVNALAAYRSVNFEGTKHLAEQAAAAGVRRLIFLSSVGVLGIHTNNRGPFSTLDIPKPVEDYALSKWEAEQALWKISDRTGLEVVIVRPPLVYGPGVKGNFLRLLQLVSSSLPLPLGSILNKRSLIGLDNLVDLLIRCIDHPTAVGQTLLVSDGDDLSTPELIRKLSKSIDKTPYLLNVPELFLRIVGKLTGQVTAIERIMSSLQIDSRYTRELLDWTPPVSTDEGLRKTGQWFLDES